MITMHEIFAFKKKGMGPDGRVLGAFMPTQIRPKFLEKLRVSGIIFPRKACSNACSKWIERGKDQDMLLPILIVFVSVFAVLVLTRAAWGAVSVFPRRPRRPWLYLNRLLRSRSRTFLKMRLSISASRNCSALFRMDQPAAAEGRPCAAVEPAALSGQSEMDSRRADPDVYDGFCSSGVPDVLYGRGL